MLKWDIEKATKELLGGSVFAGILLFVTMVAIFHSLPAHPWPFVLAILYFAEVILAVQRVDAVRQAATLRTQWRDTLVLRAAIVAVHRGELDDHVADSDFWDEMIKLANEGLEFADARRSTEADLYGEPQSRAVISFAVSFFGQAVLVALAWLAAPFWP
jgi:hypothetical protein